MNTSKLMFGTAINGTDETGLIYISEDKPIIFCLCTKEIADIILKSFQSSEQVNSISKDIIDTIANMKDDSGRPGCTYGDTDFDSLSVMYGYNFAIDNIVSKLQSLCQAKPANERLQYLETLINNPEINNFLEGVKTESAHQSDRWGMEHEENKYPHDYALVLDKLKGKQAQAIWEKDIDKYKHHLITMAAVCYNSHRQISKAGTNQNKYFISK